MALSSSDVHWRAESYGFPAQKSREWVKGSWELGSVLREPKCRILSTDTAVQGSASLVGLEDALHFPPPSFVRITRTSVV